jgi:cytochrome c-type biogenesis protein
MLDVSIWGAFIGGLVVFFSPCVLPIVPFYISYMAGAGLVGLKKDGVVPANIRRKAVISSIFFSLGIITVFVLLGAAAFSVSQAFRGFQDEFRWFAAAIIFIMGLHFLGVFKIGLLDRQFQLNVGDTGKMDVVGSFLVGLAFAAGWTPCVGGVLTAVIMTASLESSAYRGLLLLFIFGIGLTLPFVLAAFFIKPFLKFAAQFRPYLGFMEKLMGLILIFFAILMVTGSISKIANWMLVAFPTLFGV